jgi:hypothetical protein
MMVIIALLVEVVEVVGVNHYQLLVLLITFLVVVEDFSPMEVVQQALLELRIRVGDLDLSMVEMVEIEQEEQMGNNI